MALWLSAPFPIFCGKWRFEIGIPYAPKNVVESWWWQLQPGKGDNYVVKMAIKTMADMVPLWSSLHGWQLQVWVQEEGLPNPLCRGAFVGGVVFRGASWYFRICWHWKSAHGDYCSNLVQLCTHRHSPFGWASSLILHALRFSCYSLCSI